jgi:acrylyl-CoA reductase (NADPH)
MENNAYFKDLKEELRLREFRALRSHEIGSNFELKLDLRKIEDLVEYPIVIKVAASSINYKDSLSAQGNKGITRNYPHTPGIDAAGTIVWLSPKCKRIDLKIGSKVIITGFDLGMNTDGGWGEYISVPDEWPIILPPSLNFESAMIYGTAGLTAAMAIDSSLKQLGSLQGRKVAVTGASGGVSSIAILILKKLGAEVHAFTRLPNEEKIQFLSELGVDSVHEYPEPVSKPLLKQEWDAVFDSCGGAILEHFIKTTTFNGIVNSYGMVTGTEINLTVFPFILRGVVLNGLASADSDQEYKSKLWNNLNGPWSVRVPKTHLKIVNLEQVDLIQKQFTNSGAQGRVVIAHQ